MINWKQLRLVAIFCLSTSAMFSQEYRVSIITGPNFSWMSADDNQILTEGSKLGYKIHVNGEYGFNERYALTGGLGISLAQGGSLRYVNGGNLWSEASLSSPVYDSLPNGVLLGYSTNYVEIPFGFKIRTNAFGRIKFYFNAPEFSIGFRTRARGAIEGPGIPSTKDENINRQILFLNFSYGIGLGTELEISEDLALIAGGRFFQSITDVTDDSGRFFNGKKENSKGVLSSVDIRIGVLF